jgi:hypothetical protein
MPEGCAATEQIMGSGMTVYYSVNSLDTVSPGAQIFQEMRSFPEDWQADYIRWRREFTNMVVVPVSARHLRVLMGGL